MGAVKTTESISSQEMRSGEVVGRSVADLIYRFIEDNEIVVLGSLLSLVVAFSLLRSHHKQFSFDEIFTIIVSTQPDLHHFAAAMPADGNPPLNTFLTRLAIEALGVSQISVRLAPLFGFLTALAGVYIFVRREAGAALGILAVALTLFGPVWEYSYEARPYGMLMGTFMIALVSWQEATRIGDKTERRSRGLALCCLALGILGCAFSHYIGLLEIGFPLLVGEAARSYYRRRIDWPLVATAVCCLPSVLLIRPMMIRTSNAVVSNSYVLQRPITLEEIHSYFRFARVSWPLVMDNDLLALVLLVALVTSIPFAKRAFSSREARTINTELRTYVLWACVAASFLIPVTWVALAFGKGWYFCRYGIGSALGVIMCLCLILARRKLRSPAFIVGMILAAVLPYVYGLVQELRAGTPTYAANEIINTERSNLPIVIANPLTYLTIWWYSPTARQPSVVYLGGRPLGHFTLASEGLMAEKPYFQAPLLNWESFLSQNSHFLFAMDDSEFGLPMDSRKLFEERGFAIKPVRTNKGATLFDVERPSIGQTGTIK